MNKFLRIGFIVLAVTFSLTLLTNCGSNPATGDEKVAADDNISEKAYVASFEVNGEDVLAGGDTGLEFPVGEEIVVDASIGIEMLDLIWFGNNYRLHVLISTAGSSVLDETYPFTAAAPGEYDFTLSFIPAVAGDYHLESSLFTGGGTFLGSYSNDFDVTEDTGLGPLNLSDDCAHGWYMLAGIKVSLIDEDCDGLLEQYGCDDDPLVGIAHGEEVFDCGLRIVNGTVGNDRYDFRWTDRQQGGVAISTVLAGGPGDEDIAGSSADDLLLGAAGEDNLDGREGNDSFSCGSDDDDCDGEAGDDIIDCGTGNDWCVGKGGDDTIIGGPGADFIDGYQGNDTIDSGDGDDAVYGGNDDDIINCGNGDDICKGGEGSDTINGGAGTDYCTGGGGGDVIDCGPGTDLVNGGNSDDTIISNDDSFDRVNGNDGHNTCTIDCNLSDAGFPDEDRDLAVGCTTLICAS